MVNYGLYLITSEDIVNNRDIDKIIEALSSKKINFLQLRAKKLDNSELLSFAKLLQPICKKYNVTLVINDNIQVAKELNCGVHLGQDDINIMDAKKILGNNALIGISCATLSEAIRAQNDGASYIGVGAIYQTNSKSNTRKVTLKELKEIRVAVTLPIVAIGGINETNIKEVVSINVNGVAIISAIFNSDNISKSIDELYKYIK